MMADNKNVILPASMCALHEFSVDVGSSYNVCGQSSSFKGNLRVFVCGM